MVQVVAAALANVDEVRLELEIPGVADARALRDRLSAQLRTHLLPRLREADQPALVVFGGSTGAGKSTLVNSVVGAEVSPAGFLRPTTRRPVLIVHPTDEEAMSTHPLAGGVTVVSHPDVPPGISILDTPDLDSVNEANRALGAQLIEAADLWVFVTTAARYGDALPWSLLRAAHGRGVTVTVVLNRVSAAALQEVRADLLNRLVAAGLGSAPLFVLPDLGPHEGLLPPEHVAEFDRWLDLLAGRTQGAAVVARTIRGSWPSLRTDLGRLADAVDEQVAAAARLRRSAREEVDSQAGAVVADLASGTPARGGPTVQWLSVATAGGPLSILVTGGHRGGSRRRRRGGGRLHERTRAAAALKDAVVSAVVGAVVDASARAERAIREAWQEPEVGAAALAAQVEPAVAARERARRARRATTAWADGVVAEMASWEPPLPARPASMLDAGGWAGLVCAAAGGVDGAARAVTAALGARGAASVDGARAGLLAAAGQAVGAEAEAFLALVDGLGLDDSAALGLRVRASELRGVV